jgi:hypothetical protein
MWVQRGGEDRITIKFHQAKLMVSTSDELLHQPLNIGSTGEIFTGLVDGVHMLRVDAAAI